MLEEVFQRNFGCPVFGSVPAQIAWNSEQPGLVSGVPVHDRGVEMR